MTATKTRSGEVGFATDAVTKKGLRVVREENGNVLIGEAYSSERVVNGNEVRLSPAQARGLAALLICAANWASTKEGSP